MGFLCPEPAHCQPDHAGRLRIPGARTPRPRVRSFLDRTADGPEVLTEGQGRVPPSVLEEQRELDLLPKGLPVPDSISLPPLRLPTAFGDIEELGNTGT